MAEIFQLVYISQAAEDISYSDILKILDVSRRRNQDEHISGVLIFRDGYFLQLIEGEEAGVHALLNRILEDERNFNLKILIKAHRAERLFASGSMAFHDGDISSASSKILEDLFQISLWPGTEKMDDFILPLLRKFRDSEPALK